ncbi:MAG: SusC/RagA family TonB-linked outer membrane protein [Lewinellaceae bacterium]|nr:SusC/RagA family TonB-linked outer membrane protein [Lewinellaceae bacterium]
MLLILSMPLIMFGQRTITGTVTDSNNGEPLIGANILVKETGRGTITDLDGTYSLQITGDDKTLVFSYTGYSSQEIAIGASNEINVALSLGAYLEEVVVVGYGTVKREDATGSLQAVSSKDFNKGAITGPQELLAGKIPGVTINTYGGPGSGAKIRIRGESSLTASNDPLIIVDGVPLDNGGISGNRNPLSIINPNDIESMTVLKDASAAAIYGNRASAGVILITTKKGKVGDALHVGYTGNVSFGNPINRVDALTADEYRQVIFEQFPEGHPARSLMGDANTDWQSEIYHTAVGTDHTAYVSGSVGTFPYRVSLGYTNMNGILKTDKFERYIGGVNLNPSFLNNALQVNLSAKAFLNKNVFANQSAIGYSVGFDPTQAVYDPESPYGGFTTWTAANGNPVTVAAPFNPVALLEMRDDQSTVNRYIINASADYRFWFLPDLRANLNLAYDGSNSDGTVFVPQNAAWAFNAVHGGGTDNMYSQKKENSLLEFYLNYKKSLRKHTIDLMGGYSWQHFFVDNYSLNSNVAHTPAETVEFKDPAEYYLVSLFGRLNYSFSSRYLLTFTLRRDGTSRFSPESRWGLFPAAAFAVKVLENSNNTFNNIKLRLGWGVTGQQDINDYYAYMARYQYSFDNARYQFGDQFITTIRPNGYDANIRWEETTTYNAGLDFSIVRDRLSGTFDIYQRDTKDLLNEIPIPAGTNLTNFIVTNVGNMKNHGFELSLITTPVLTKNISWDLAVNGSYNTNKITKLLATDDENYQGVLTGGISGGVGSNIQIHSVGYAPSSFFVYQQLYDADGNLLEGEFADRNEDGIVNAEDKYRFKKPAADYTIGFTSALNVHGFTLSFAGRAALGNYVYNNIETDQGYLARLFNGASSALWNIHQSAVDLNVKNQANLTFSDYFVQEASYLKIDHITLSYDLKKLLGLGINVYATAQNPLVFTKYTGLDPEIGNGIDNNLYPRARTFVFGVSGDFSVTKKK